MKIRTVESAVRRVAVVLLLALGVVRGAAADADGEDLRPALRVFSHSSYRPYAYFENGQPHGLALDLMRELAQRMGRRLDVLPVELQQAEERLARGEADVLFPMVRMDGAQSAFDFSDPVYPLQFAIFTAASRKDVATVADLHGLRVGVTASGFGRQLLKADPAIRMVPMNDYAHGFSLLRAGDVDALISDRWVGAYEINARSIPDVRAAAADVAVLSTMLMVRKGEAALLASLNEGLRTMARDGTIARLRDQWRPPETVFVSHEPINWRAIVGGFALLLILLSVRAVWTIALRREVALRRQREHEIVALHQRLAIATQAGGIGIWDWEVERDILTWDDEMYRLYGMRRGDSPANYAVWARSLHPEDRDRAEAEVRAALAGERPYDTEFRICHPDAACT